METEISAFDGMVLSYKIYELEKFSGYHIEMEAYVRANIRSKLKYALMFEYTSAMEKKTLERRSRV